MGLSQEPGCRREPASMGKSAELMKLGGRSPRECGDAEGGKQSLLYACHSMNILASLACLSKQAPVTRETISLSESTIGWSLAVQDKMRLAIHPKTFPSCFLTCNLASLQLSYLQVIRSTLQLKGNSLSSPGTSSCCYYLLSAVILSKVVIPDSNGLGHSPSKTRGYPNSQ